MTTWTMFAGVNPRYETFQHVASDPRYAQAYGDEPVEVTVTEDPDGEYWGWLDARDEGDVEPTMIQPHLAIYRMQFPYGPEAEEERGRGRTVRLRIVDRSEGDQP